MSEMNGGAGDGAVVFDITARTDGFENALGTITRSLTDAASGWDDIAFRFATTLGLAISDAISNAIDEGVDLASNLEEISNRINVAFGEEGAKKIDNWSKTVHEKFGISELQAKNYVSLLGAQFAATGMDKGTALDYAIRVAERIGDIASLYDVKFDTVFRKARSGISGIARPLYDYGIDLTKNTVSSAYSKNNPEDGRKWDALSEWEQEIARMIEFFRQTEYLAGDFERTQDSYANLGRRGENAWQAFLINLGNFFLPFRTNQRKVGVGLLESLAYGPSAERLLGPLASNVSSSPSLPVSSWIAGLFGAPSANDLIAQGKKTQDERAYSKEQYAAMAEAYVAELDAQIAKGIENGYGDSLLRYQRQRDIYENEDFSTYNTDELVTTIDHLEDVLSQVYKTLGVGEQEQVFSSLKQSIDQAASDVSNAGNGAASSILGAGASVSGALSSVAGSIMTVGAVGVISGIGKLFGSHANGLDNVPYDGYMAILHQGERVQTAAEASLSRRYSMAQPQSFDYGAMGSAIGAHLPQGNMQIVWRGRVVAEILSEMQGDSYRALERSQWRS